MFLNHAIGQPFRTFILCLGTLCSQAFCRASLAPPPKINDRDHGTGSPCDCPSCLIVPWLFSGLWQLAASQAMLNRVSGLFWKAEGTRPLYFRQVWSLVICQDSRHLLTDPIVACLLLWARPLPPFWHIFLTLMGSLGLVFLPTWFCWCKMTHFLYRRRRKSDRYKAEPCLC